MDLNRKKEPGLYDLVPFSGYKTHKNFMEKQPNKFAQTVDILPKTWYTNHKYTLKKSLRSVFCV